MSTKVRDVMTTHVVAVSADAFFKEMAAQLRHYRVSAFPVIDRTRRVIGVANRFLTDPRKFTITVRQGIVTLEGPPGDRGGRPRAPTV